LEKGKDVPMAAPIPFAALVAVAIVAISKSQRKWLTLLFIIGWIAAGIALGATVGYAAANAEVAGGWAGISGLVMGIGASIERIYNNQKLLDHKIAKK
jgi:hypothetical protein